MPPVTLIFNAIAVEHDTRPVELPVAPCALVLGVVGEGARPITLVEALEKVSLVDSAVYIGHYSLAVGEVFSEIANEHCAVDVDGPPFSLEAQVPVPFVKCAVVFDLRASALFFVSELVHLPEISGILTAGLFFEETGEAFTFEFDVVEVAGLFPDEVGVFGEGFVEHGEGEAGEVGSVALSALA